jgi:predicted nucleic-acid-binding Zn-ribbon protein/ribosomal protein L40E
MLSFPLLFDIIMKNSGKCPKCGSSRIWTTENQKSLGVGNGIWFKISTWRSGRLVLYICLDCGYGELMCDDDGIKTIEKHAMKSQDIPNVKNCPICGAKVPQDAHICDECGSVID